MSPKELAAKQKCEQREQMLLDVSLDDLLAEVMHRCAASVIVYLPMVGPGGKQPNTKLAFGCPGGVYCAHGMMNVSLKMMEAGLLTGSMSDAAS